MNPLSCPARYWVLSESSDDDISKPKPSTALIPYPYPKSMALIPYVARVSAMEFVRAECEKHKSDFKFYAFIISLEDSFIDGAFTTRLMVQQAEVQCDLLLRMLNEMGVGYHEMGHAYATHIYSDL